MEPLVSILTPSLNHAQHVEESILSVRRQDYPHIEQIVVDGGSTDGTLDVLRRYENDHLRVYVERGNQAQALNTAFARSSGDLIGWLNTDDAFVTTHVVSDVVDAFNRDPECIVVYGDALVSDPDGRILRYVYASTSELARRQDLSPLVQPAVFFRREAVGARFIREDIRSAIDYELWLRLMRRGRFRKLRQPLAIDRDSPARLTRVDEAARLVDCAELADEYALKRPLPTIVAAARRWLLRVRGVRPLLMLERENLAFDARLDGRRALLVRQLLRTQRAILES